MNIRNRILHGVASNAFSLAVTLGIQLASVPMFLHFWTPAEYGTWLILSAIPAYFSMADMGVTAVLANRMTILVARQKQARANETFEWAFTFTTVVSICAASLSAVALTLSSLSNLISPGKCITLMLLILCAIGSIFGGLAEGIFRAEQQFAKGNYLVNTSRLLEWLGAGAGLLISGSMTGAAAGMLTLRVFSIISIILICTRQQSNYKWKINFAGKRIWRRLAPLSIAYLGLPMVNAINIQGSTVLIGSLFGSTTIAIVNTSRTIFRLVTQVVAMITKSVWPEFTRLYAINSADAFRKLLSKSYTFTLSASAVGIAIVTTIAPALLQAWTHGKIQTNLTYSIPLAVATFLGSVWQLPMVALLATNKHSEIAGRNLVVSVVCIFTGGVAAILMHSASAVLWLLVVYELIMLLSSATKAANIMNRHA